MINQDSIETLNAGGQDGREPQSATPPLNPDYPDIPYPIIRPARGSPYYIDPYDGRKSRLFAPGSPPLTSEDVRKALEDFP